MSSHEKTYTQRHKYTPVNRKKKLISTRKAPVEAVAQGCSIGV